MSSATTYVAVPIVGEDIATAQTKARAIAVERLGGETGLTLVTINTIDGPRLTTTWRRDIGDPPAGA